MKKRPVDIVVISDVHLGTYGCHANELLRYMKSISPKEVVLNGDIIDIWQFSKRYWPKSHMKVVKYLMGWIAKGIKVHYITGNHDEMLRKFVGFQMGSLSIVNKVVLTTNGKKAWFFHGDVFDVTMQHSKWVAKLGAKGYDFLILLNRAINFLSKRLGKGPISMSKKIKNGVKSAVKFINNFETTASEIAIENGYEFVVCGHIHQPEIRNITSEKGEVTYLNSGDWIENLTALEYTHGEWELYSFYDDLGLKNQLEDSIEESPILEKSELFQSLLDEFRTSGLVKLK